MQWYRAEATSGANTPSLSVVSRVFTSPGAGGLLNSSSTFLRVLTSLLRFQPLLRDEHGDGGAVQHLSLRHI